MTQPDWYDESKAVNAIFAFEDGVSVYGGWVIDLGDGTCRLANSPMLGEDGPEWGDRVDLFYNPTDRGSRPWIGYRIYPENIDEVPGRNFGARRELTDDEIQGIKEKELERENSEIRKLEERHEQIDLRFKVTELAISLSKSLQERAKLELEVKELKRKLNDAKGNDNVEK